MINFWQQLKKPIFALAPMLDVTDNAFRMMFAKYSRLESGDNFVLFTEFVSTDGLCSDKGREKLLHYLDYTEGQRPIVAQIWGNKPEKFYRAAQIIAELKFDGVDINMGCPQSKEISSGACAALMRDYKLAQEIILATKQGAGNMPVSVKTRIGYSKPETESWIANLLETKPAVITVHGRTKQEMSKVPAHWDEIKKAVGVRNQMQSKTLILGNGDIKSYEEGLQRAAETGVDGVMVGRGAFGDPWFFNPSHKLVSIKDRLRAAVEHAELFEKLYGGRKPFMVMRKHFKAYANGFDGAPALRAQLMETKNAAETAQIVEEFLNP